MNLTCKGSLVMLGYEKHDWVDDLGNEYSQEINAGVTYWYRMDNAFNRVLGQIASYSVFPLQDPAVSPYSVYWSFDNTFKLWELLERPKHANPFDLESGEVPIIPPVSTKCATTFERLTPYSTLADDAEQTFAQEVRREVFRTFREWPHCKQYPHSHHQIVITRTIGMQLKAQLICPNCHAVKTSY